MYKVMAAYTCPVGAGAKGERGVAPEGSPQGSGPARAELPARPQRATRPPIWRGTGAAEKTTEGRADKGLAASFRGRGLSEPLLSGPHRGVPALGCRQAGKRDPSPPAPWLHHGQNGREGGLKRRKRAQRGAAAAAQAFLPAMTMLLLEFWQWTVQRKEKAHQKIYS